ncbi:Sialic acid TRAP transporter permease protein SiaT [Pseudovibrio sp. W64]|uniref:TRAP transporter large permease n=1 Tax=Pseudovibrio sp. W64 TaxID=1735583 RepID=UPI0007AED7EA|nr:TRAP transporter large permease [Pseudovibrio sp. W64]KZK77966.1 Sialic acid TRAP transporter permease protein SiaT [Pseudovibrio sp. W64]
MIVALLFVVSLLIGLPIGVAIGVATFAGYIALGGGIVDNNFLVMIPSKIFSALNSFAFLAMPFFILAGEIMNKTGITDRILLFAKALVGHWRGGLAHTNMLASLLFAGVSGSATADAAAFGRTLVPAMVRNGYTRSYACAITAAGSIVGPTVPPSSLMVLYGSIMGVSIAGLFASGILPGAVITLLCMAMITLTARAKNLPREDILLSRRIVWAAFKKAFLALLMPGIILGGILGGIVTPTEAAAIAVGYALFIGMFVYKNLKLSDLPEILARTARINGVVFLIVAIASALGWWLGFERIPQNLSKGLLVLSDNKDLILLMLIGILLAFGMVMDITAVLIIMGPVLLPIMAQIGLDPIHAGIIVVLALNISLMTPPIGACLFVLSSVTGERIGGIMKDLWPFLLLEVAILLGFAFLPDVALFIPRLLGF